MTEIFLRPETLGYICKLLNVQKTSRLRVLWNCSSREGVQKRNNADNSFLG